MLGVAAALLIAPSAHAAVHDVTDRAGLIDACALAAPGDTIRLTPGVYAGGAFIQGLHGEPGRPITLAALDPDDPPVFRGGASGLQLSGVSHVVLEHLVFEGATGNGLNIDDAGRIDSPTHHVTLRGLVVRDVGPDGNRDGIKLSGVVDFAVLDCTLADWGAGGSGIDLVGCHRGVICGCTLSRTTPGATGVQMKGGTSAVRVLACRFENAGARAVNLGGSTGREYFRPALSATGNAEARELEVAGCVFVGPGVPVAFVGQVGSRLHHNTVIDPGPWVFRVLQESADDDFEPCADGVFERNLIVYRRSALRRFVNVGPGTRVQTFTVRENWWYASDDPAASEPTLPVPETDGVHSRDPMLNDDGRLTPDSPATAYGADAWMDDAAEANGAALR